MRRNPKDTVVGLLLIGIALLITGWMAETVLFIDLGGHSGNSDVLDVIESAARDGVFTNLDDETHLHNAALRVSIEATRASMDRVRFIRSYTVWLFVFGILFVIAGGVKALRMPVAVLGTGE